MSLKIKLLALFGLSFTLVVTAACMGKKSMTKEQLELACKDVEVKCEDVFGAATSHRGACDYKCNKYYTNTNTSTSTSTSTSTNTVTNWGVGDGGGTFRDGP